MYGTRRRRLEKVGLTFLCRHVSVSSFSSHLSVVAVQGGPRWAALGEALKKLDYVARIARES